MRDTSHVHAPGSAVEIDRCHQIEFQRICSDCGEREVVYEPRDFREPGQVAFADPGCPVCRERVALDGVWPDAWGALV